LKLHGIEVHFIEEPLPLQVERYKLSAVKFASRPYEGRQRVDFVAELCNEEVVPPVGTAIVYTQQRTLRVIVNLLEPQGPDSYVQWGFFNAFFERKEYAEPYIMEPIARQMMAENPELRREFLDRLEIDPAFASDPLARLDFFYRHSLFFDERECVYPIMRLTEERQLRHS
jgi:hypothetical protein